MRSEILTIHNFDNWWIKRITFGPGICIIFIWPSPHSSIIRLMTLFVNWMDCKIKVKDEVIKQGEKKVGLSQEKKSPRKRPNGKLHNAGEGER